MPKPTTADACLSTRDCADRLGVTTAFIVGEIRDGRLCAFVLERRGCRRMYRIAPEDFAAYVKRYSWTPSKRP